MTTPTKTDAPLELPADHGQIDAFLKKNKKRIGPAFIERHLDAFSPAHWATLSQHVALPEDFLVRHKDRIDWKKAFKHQRFSEDLIERKQHAGRPIWKSILTNKLLDESLIEKYWLLEKMPWKFKSDQDWAIFTARQFSRAFIERHPGQLSTFMHTQKLDADYIQARYWLIVAECDKYSTSYGCRTLYEDWAAFRKKQKHLPDSFFAQLERHSEQDAYRVLDAATIQAVGADKVNWDAVGRYAPLTPELLEAFRDRIHPTDLDSRLKFKAEAPARAQALQERHAKQATEKEHLVDINNFMNECHREGLADLAIGLYEALRGAQDTFHLNPYVFHNTACLYVDHGGEGDHAKAIDEVRKACEHDYENLDWLFQDVDLKPISQDETFQQLKREHEARMAEMEDGDEDDDEDDTGHGDSDGPDDDESEDDER